MVSWSTSVPVWLALYFVLNLSLTLYNKVMLNHFPFPYTLTALHALCGSIGTFLLLHWSATVTKLRARLNPILQRRHSKRHNRILTSPTSTMSEPSIPAVPSLRGKEVLVLFLFSILYSVNIVVSNASLRLVTVPFHQVVRASTPLFTVALSAVLLGKYCSRAKLLTLIPVIAGVGFATYGDYYFTPQGFILTLLGTVLAAIKTITTNLLQQKSSSATATVNSSGSKLPARASNGRQNAEVNGTNGTSTATEKLEFVPERWNEAIQVTYKSDYETDSPHLQSGPLLQASEIDEDLEPISQNPPIKKTGISGLVDGLLPFTRRHTRLHSVSPMSMDGSALPVPWTRLRTRIAPILARLELPKLTLTPLQLLYLLSPIAFVQTTLLAHFSGELERVNVHLSQAASEYARKQAGSAADGVWMGFWGLGGAPRLWLLLNGVLAFLLNVVSFSANRKVGALAMTVAANVKQVLAVLCSVTLFNLNVTPMNGLGIFLTILGGAWYAAVELREKGKAAK
ncbi:TPT-domain-containing protein [Coprinopsis marcescibilis]|uniref:TPT-domain-containing protein n=1 Tax=Coprinopsis marcescibilis TaxID=230819 RepID=A0A5C3L9I7_COPMA|nr:TPT-domain-containing protein [Coprinopsis marcescibilis]